jgi:hypothetical protein
VTDKPYKIEVQADSTGTWAGNALRFETGDQAADYANDLWSRWTAVRHWRVLKDDKPVRWSR